MRVRSNYLRTLGLGVAVAAIPVAVPAQFASYTKVSTSCANPKRVNVSVDGTLPIPGRYMTVTTRGPAYAPGWLVFSPRWLGSRGIDLSNTGMTGCKLYVGLSNAITLPMRLRSNGSHALTFRVPSSTPRGTLFFNQSFVRAAGTNPLGVLSTNAGMARVGDEPNLTAAQIKSFAPVLKLHPSSIYYPMDPNKFVKASRFRHHRSFWPDQGYHKVNRKWYTNNDKSAPYFDIPVSYINSYRMVNGKNRRPRDGNSGSSWNVFLAPEGRPAGDRTPNYDVPAYYHYRRVGDEHIVQFWYFFGFNDSLASFNHQGDWEHCTVHVVRGAISKVYFAAHHGGSYKYGSQVKRSGTHPVVYIAKGSHASYWAAGTYFNYLDKCADGGYTWRTELNLKPLGSQPWKDYAGAWGDVGLIETTTGPLGPWHKRLNR